ncbi:MAG: hypothetical protein NTY35_02560 [Planctomycetota bacterium]|nr:hypothetical protein [Planctomycetota bacterium]
MATPSVPSVSSSALPPPANDNCASASLIVGLGPHAFDNTTATTGTQGQAEALCNLQLQTRIDDDIWFVWRAPFAGPAELRSCGSTPNTKIAVYPGQGCPTAQALGCNDDSCGLQSRVQWTVTQGAFYTIQLGRSPGGLGVGPGTFSITPAVFPPNDDCLNASPLSGFGTFAFDTTFATATWQGQFDPTCAFNGSTTIPNDLWYTWISPISGDIRIETCGSTIDTKLSVFSTGSGCPTVGGPVCNDDFCGLASRVVLANVTAGDAFTIQLGASPYAPGGGAGTLRIEPSLAPPNDDCNNPQTLVGEGLFNFDFTSATTGSEGQFEAACSFFGVTAFPNDVWFQWVSPFTGTVEVDTCGTQVEGRTALYAGSGCPSAPAIACNDIYCYYGESRVSATVNAGQTYTIQLGRGLSTPSIALGQLRISRVFPPVNDQCSTPEPISGTGLFPFDNTRATTGLEGQQNPQCASFGFTQTDNDVWFRWIAPLTGLYSISTCGLAQNLDTKLAVYSGVGCSGIVALECNDYACFYESNVCLDAIAGQVYTIQIGTFLGAPGLAGEFRIQLTPPPTSTCSPLDDGRTEDALTTAQPGEIAWMQGFGSPGQQTRVTRIETTFGSAQFPTTGPPAGAPFTVALWDDPNDDGDIGDGVLLVTASGTIAAGSVETDVFQSISIPPTDVSGVFFVGAVTGTTGPPTYPAPIDSDSAARCDTRPGSFVAAALGTTFDYQSLGLNALAPMRLESVGIQGTFLLRAECTPIFTGTPFCFGDGQGTPCPCGNNAAPGTNSGCRNSLGLGALLRASGSASISSDTVRLDGSQMLNGTALYFQGSAQFGGGLGTVFGDGLRCAGGTIRRLAVRVNSGGASFLPSLGSPSISALGQVSVPGARSYQVWYRNAAAFCTSSTFNLSNGISLDWQL